MIGTNFPFVKYLPKKNIKAIQIDTNEDILVTVLISTLVS